MPEGVVQCTPCRRVPPPSGRRDPPCGFPAWGMSCRAPRRAAGSPPGLCAPAFLDAAADPPSPRPTCRRPPAGNRRPSTGPGTLAPRLGGQGPSVGAPMVQALTAASAKARCERARAGGRPRQTALREGYTERWDRGRACEGPGLREGRPHRGLLHTYDRDVRGDLCRTCTVEGRGRERRDPPYPARGDRASQALLGGFCAKSSVAGWEAGHADASGTGEVWHGLPLACGSRLDRRHDARRTAQHASESTRVTWMAEDAPDSPPRPQRRWPLIRG